MREMKGGDALAAPGARRVGSKALSQVLWKPDDSHFWVGLMAMKKHFFDHGKFLIKDGFEVCFWEVARYHYTPRTISGIV
jgi:hypothetical protein